MESNPNKGNEHAVRIQGNSGSEFVGFNVFEADGAKSGVQVRGNSTHVVLYGNVLDRNNAFTPQNLNGPPVEEQHHCIAEANIFIGRVDPVTGQILSAYNNGYVVNDNAIDVAGHDIVVRNNLIYNYGFAIQNSDYAPNVPASLRIAIENNTAVSTLPGFSIIRDHGFSITALNDLQFTTALTNSQYDMFFSAIPTPFSSTTFGTSDYNQMFGASLSASWHFFGYYPSVSLSQWQQNSSQDLHSQYANPGISVMNPVATGFATPAANSPGVNAGTTTGGWLDLYGRMRDSSPDVGAIENQP
jgi:hypothetical protein